MNQYTTPVYHTGQNKHFLLKFLVLVLVWVGLAATQSQHALAAVGLNPAPGPIPAFARSYLENCDSGSQSPAYIGWVGLSSDPSQTSITVPAGTPSVSLDFRTAGTVCYLPNQAQEARQFIISASGQYLPPVGAPQVGSIGGIAGNPKTVLFSNPLAPGNTAVGVSAFNYTPSGGGFTRSGTHQITVRSFNVQRFRNSAGVDVYRCFNQPGNIAAWDYGACPADTHTFLIQVNVGPTGGVNTITSNCSALNGSAEDGDSPGTPIQIHIYRDYPPGVAPPSNPGNPFGGLVGTTTANAATNAYSFNISAFTDGGTHTFYVFMLGVDFFGVQDGNNPQAANSPVIIGPCVTLSCGDLTTSPADPEEGQNFTISTTFTLDSGPPGAQPYTVAITMPGVYTAPNLTGNVSSGGSATATTGNIPGRPAGVYPGTFRVTVAGVSINCNRTIIIARRPYVQVFGGDVSAGGRFTGACGAASTAGIRAFNKGASSFAGSGGQLGVFASGVIDGFASASLQTPPADRLSFSNTLGGAYGGSSGMNPCIDTSSYRTTAPVGNTYTVGGVTNLAGRQIIRATGNIYIRANTQYASLSTSFGADISDIPSLTLVADGGDIFIEAGVSNITGLFVALPSGATGGNIYTCAINNGFGSLRKPTSAEITSSCGTQLKIIGSFVAKSVKFLRTAGTLQNSGLHDSPANWLTSGWNGGPAGSAGEVFLTTPALWLTDRSTPSGSGVEGIVSLPPIL